MLSVMVGGRESEGVDIREVVYVCGEDSWRNARIGWWHTKVG